MPHLEFDRITIIDFKEFRGKHVLDFKLLGVGCHFMRGENLVEPRLGSNGASKSSIWDALCWALYGRTVLGLRGVDLRTWESDKHPRVLVDVKIDGALTTITRSTTTNGLWVNDKVVTQERIDQLLGLSFTNFPHTILFAQKADLFFDLKGKEKLDLLSETLDLDRWEARSKRAKDKAQEFEIKQSSLMAQLNTLEQVHADATKALEDLKQKSADWEQALNDRETTRDKQTKIVEKALDRAELELGDYDLAYDGAETELRHSQKELDKAVNVFSDASVAYAKLGALHESAESLRVVLEQDVQDMLHGDKCPTCGQTLKGDHKEHARKARANLKAQIEIVKKTKRSWEGAGIAKNEAMRHTERFEKDVRTYRAKSNDAIDGRTRAQKKVQELKAGLTFIKEQVPATETNPYSELIVKARKQKKEAAATIDNADSLIAKLEKRKARAQYWVKGFKGVRLYLLQDVLDELTAVTQTMLPQIGLEDWVVEYHMESETKTGNSILGLNVSVMKLGMSKGAKWESWSGGEGQRLRLIGAIALSEVLLRRAGVECDLMILDEPTKHLSPEGVAETIDFLIERGRDNQIFYVDQAAQESSRFASVVNVVKDRKGASIHVR